MQRTIKDDGTEVGWARRKVRYALDFDSYSE